ncbi:hypothetical protein YC2023_015922 [Brassica napus]
MHCTGFNKAVKKAYLDQYSADTKILLDARADELVPGGLMLLFGSCLRDGVKMSETSKGILLDAVGASLNDLAKQGVIEQDKVDSFSTPLYFAEENELKQIIEENGRFTIQAFEDIIHAKGEFTLDPKQVFTKVFDLIEAKLRQELPRLLNASYKLINVSLRVINHIKTLVVNDNIIPDMLASTLSYLSHSHTQSKALHRALGDIKP